MYFWENKVDGTRTLLDIYVVPLNSPSSSSAADEGRKTNNNNKVYR